MFNLAVCYINLVMILLNLRCNTPVIIMGETGCGKTSLLRFVCSLISQALKVTSAGVAFEFNNFRSLKVSFILLPVACCIY